MRAGKRIRRLTLVICLLVLAGLALRWYLRPAIQESSEIFRGIYLTVEDIHGEDGSNGRMMLVAIHWDTPGIELAGRAFDFPPDPSDPTAPHYRLTYPDWALFREKAAVLVNTTLFYPDRWMSLLPGFSVRSNETLVVNGEVSHVHDHSYLLYWDAAGNVHLQTTKPPSRTSLEAAVTAIGIQGIPVNNGEARMNAIANHDAAHARTFIGVDPQEKILYLMAFEKATVRQMLDRAVAAGVQFGGQVDGGSSTNLLIGGKAKGLPTHSGIRGWKPMGPYLIIRAEPL